MYHREESKKMLMDLYGYKDVGSKHEENLFTKWYQSFYLFEKFGIDKRKAHYSSLINAGQMTRQEAMQLLQKSPEYQPFGIEAEVMRYKKRSHEDFKTDKLWILLAILIRQLRKPYRKLTQIGKATKD